MRPAPLVVAAWVAVLCVLAASAPAVAAPPSFAAGLVSQATTPDEEQPGPTVRITGLTPLSPQPGDLLVVTGTVANRGEEELGAVQALLRLSQDRLETRADVVRVGEDPDFRRGLRVETVFDPLADALPPGESAPFRLEVPLDDLGLGPAGVYVVGVDVRASLPEGGRETVAEDRTLLPWQVDDERPVPMALLWPLAARPVLLAGGRLSDDQLAGQLAPGGRLGRLVEAPGDAPVTWLADPDLVRTADAMADGYEVVGPGQSGGSPGTGEEAARDWLELLRERLAGAGQLALLPTADPDANGLVAVGGTGPALLSRAVRASSAGPAALGSAADGARVLAWPVEGRSDTRTLAALDEVGADGVLLAGSTGTARARATGVATEGPPVTVLDAGLGEALRAAQEGATPLEMRQQLLAETAMASLDDEVVALVAAPDRRWRLPAAYLQAVLAAWQRPPWVRPVTLDGARSAAAEEGPDAESAELAVADQPGPRIGLRTLRNATRVEARLQRLRAATLADDQVLRDLDDATVRMASTAWRWTPAAADELQRRTAASVAFRTGQVRVLAAETVVLSGDSGRFPLTVANDLPVPVRVRVEVVPESRDRLRVVEIPEVEVAAGAKETVTVAAEAAANGRVAVAVRLATPDGEGLGPARRVIVVATDYGVVGWIVIVVAGALLAGAAAVRTTRRVRGARAAEVRR